MTGLTWDEIQNQPGIYASGGHPHCRLCVDTLGNITYINAATRIMGPALGSVWKTVPLVRVGDSLADLLVDFPVSKPQPLIGPDELEDWIVYETVKTRENSGRWEGSHIAKIPGVGVVECGDDDVRLIPGDTTLTDPGYGYQFRKTSQRVQIAILGAGEDATQETAGDLTWDHIRKTPGQYKCNAVTISGVTFVSDGGGSVQIRTNESPGMNAIPLFWRHHRFTRVG